MGLVRAADGGMSWITLYHGGGSGILFVLRRRFAWARTRAGRKSYFPIVGLRVKDCVMRRCSTFLGLIRRQLLVANMVDVQRDDVSSGGALSRVYFDKMLKSQLESQIQLRDMGVYCNCLLMIRWDEMS